MPTCSTLYEECLGSLTSHRFITCARACETGPTVYRPYPRKAALSPQLFKDPECWSGRGLNLRPPAQRTAAGAYPIELTGRRFRSATLDRYWKIKNGCLIMRQDSVRSVTPARSCRPVQGLVLWTSCFKENNLKSLFFSSRISCRLIWFI